MRPLRPSPKSERSPLRVTSERRRAAGQPPDEASAYREVSVSVPAANAVDGSLRPGDRVGFLGIGADYYPIPWASLSYDTSLGGYRTNITEQQLQGAPKYAGDSWDWEDRERGRKVYEYYGMPWREY